MSRYKYPFIPREYYPAVMYACNCIRKYGTFNVAVNTAAKEYGVDRETVAKYVRQRQGAGQKGTTRKYKWFVVVGWGDVWCSWGDVNMLLSAYDRDEWVKNRKRVALVIKATDSANARKKIPNGTLQRNGEILGNAIVDYEMIQFDSEKDANAYFESISTITGGI